MHVYICVEIRICASVFACLQVRVWSVSACMCNLSASVCVCVHMLTHVQTCTQPYLQSLSLKRIIRDCILHHTLHFLCNHIPTYI